MKSAAQFLSQLQNYYGGKPKTETGLQVTIEELDRSFVESQWEPLYRAVVKSDERFMPNLGRILQIGREANIRRPEGARKSNADWTMTDCKLCDGEGLLQVIMLRELDQNRKIKRSFVTLGRHSAAKWQDHKFEDGHAAYVFRCACERGLNHSAGWPRWDIYRNSGYVDYRDFKPPPPPDKGGFGPAGSREI